MSELFGFLSMANNYDERMVARYKSDDGKLFISTAAVVDSDDPFETAVAHPRYNEGKLIIVETYSSRELAKAGHDKWLAKMTSTDLPKELIDVSTCGLADLSAAAGNSMCSQLQRES